MVIGAKGRPLQTVQWQSGKVKLIDQTALPERLSYVELSDWREVAEAIRTMVVRGAPAIGTRDKDPASAHSCLLFINPCNIYIMIVAWVHLK